MKTANVLLLLAVIGGGYYVYTKMLVPSKKKTERIAYLRSAMATAQAAGDNAKYVELQNEYIRLTA